MYQINKIKEAKLGKFQNYAFKTTKVKVPKEIQQNVSIFTKVICIYDILHEYEYIIWNLN